MHDGKVVRLLKGKSNLHKDYHRLVLAIGTLLLFLPVFHLLEQRTLVAVLEGRPHLSFALKDVSYPNDVGVDKPEKSLCLEVSCFCVFRRHGAWKLIEFDDSMQAVRAALYFLHVRKAIYHSKFLVAVLL